MLADGQTCGNSAHGAFEVLALAWSIDLVMNEKTPRSNSVAKKLVHELREYAGISAYLYVCFAALLFYKFSILNDEGVKYAPFGLAAIKALVLGKFIMLGRMGGLGDRHKKRSAIFVIAQKSLVFVIMLLVVSVLEEVVVGLIRGQTISTSLSIFMGGSYWQILAVSAIMLLILVLYMALEELRDAFGDARLRQLMLEPRAPRRPDRNPEPMDDDAPIAVGVRDALAPPASSVVEKL